MALITYGQAVSGSLTPSSPESNHRPGSYAAYYTFEGEEGDYVDVIQSSETIDGALYLIDTDGTTVIDWDGGTYIELRALLTKTGTYTIEVTSWDAGITGDYLLELDKITAILEDNFTDTSGTPLANHTPDQKVPNTNYTSVYGGYIVLSGGKAEHPFNAETCCTPSSLYNLGVASNTWGGIPLNASYDITFTLNSYGPLAERHEFNLVYAGGAQGGGVNKYGRLQFRPDTGIWYTQTASSLTGNWVDVDSVSSPASGGHNYLVQVREDSITLSTSGSTILTSTDAYKPFGLSFPATNNVWIGWLDSLSDVSYYSYNDDFNGTGLLTDHLTDEGVGWVNTSQPNDRILTGGKVEFDPAYVSGSHTVSYLKPCSGWCPQYTSASLTFTAPQIPLDPMNGVSYRTVATIQATNVAGYVSYDRQLGPEKYYASLNVYGNTVYVGDLSTSAGYAPVSTSIDLTDGRVKFYVDGSLLYDETWETAGMYGCSTATRGTWYVAVPNTGGGEDIHALAADGFHADTGSQVSVRGSSLDYLKITVVPPGSGTSSGSPGGPATITGVLDTDLTIYIPSYPVSGNLTTSLSTVGSPSGSLTTRLTLSSGSSGYLDTALTIGGTNAIINTALSITVNYNPSGWLAWGNIMSRITHADIRQVHRYRGTGESEKLNRVAKSNQVDVQTSNLQSKYLDYLLSVDATSGSNSMAIQARNLQHYRMQTTWRVKSGGNNG